MMESQLYCSCLICNCEVSCTIKSEDECIIDGEESSSLNHNSNLNQVETFCQLINLSFSTAEQVSITIIDGGVSFCTDCAGVLQNVTCLLEQIAKLYQEVDGYKVMIKSKIKLAYMKHINDTNERSLLGNKGDGPLSNIRTGKLRQLIMSELQSKSGIGDPLSVNTVNSKTTRIGISFSGEVETKIHDALPKRKNLKRKTPGRREREVTSIVNNETSLTQDSLSFLYEPTPTDEDGSFKLYQPSLDTSYKAHDSDDFNSNEGENQSQNIRLTTCSVDLNSIKSEEMLGLESPPLRDQVKPKRKRKSRAKPPTKLTCPDCGKTPFKSAYLLSKHKYDVHIKECPFFCHICGRRAYTQKKLDFHVAKCKKPPLPPNVTVLTAVGPSKLKCNECGYATRASTKMNRHLLSHTKEKSFVCELCGEVYQTAYTLKLHKLSKHVEETSSSLDQQEGVNPSHPHKHKCTSCDFRTITVGWLNAHVKRVHGVRSHTCDQCDAAYTTFTALKRHKYGSHTKEEDKPFKCSYCGKGFSAKIRLQQHEISVHTNERPFECKSCGKKFAIKSGLYIHMKVHQKKKKTRICKNGDSEEEEMEIADSSEVKPVLVPMELNG